MLGTLADSTGGTTLSGNDFLRQLDRLADPAEYIYYWASIPGTSSQTESTMRLR